MTSTPPSTDRTLLRCCRRTHPRKAHWTMNSCAAFTDLRSSCPDTVCRDYQHAVVSRRTARYGLGQSGDSVMDLPPEERNESPAPSKPNSRLYMPGGCALVLVGVLLNLLGFVLSFRGEYPPSPFILIALAGLLLVLTGAILFVYGLAKWSLRRPRKRVGRSTGRSRIPETRRRRN